MSGHGKIKIEKGALTDWGQQREELVRTRKEKDQARRAHLLEAAEGGTCQDQKETNPPRHTHFLETAEGGICQDTERTRLNKAHSPPEKQREGLVMIQKVADRAKHTHVLETAEGGMYQDTEKNQPSKAHSQTGDSRGRDLSGH